MYQQLSIHGFGLDKATRLPVIILTDAAERKVPLWLSADDLMPIAADLISRELAGENKSLDLVQTILGKLDLTPDRLYLDECDDGGYRSSLSLTGQSGNRLMPLSHRDAFMFALRYTLPVLISTGLLERLLMPSGASDQNREPAEAAVFSLKDLDPGKMGKYPM